MMKFRSIWKSLFLGLVLISPSVATANQNALKCDLRYDGMLTEEGVELFLRDHADELELPAYSVICLDSPGGSYSAGLRLYEVITENSVGIVTYIPPDAQCLSACSIVFLGGNTWIGQGATKQWNARVIHVGARLGFHAPFTNFSPNSTFSGKEGNEIFKLAVKALATANSMRLFTRIDGSLFNEFLFSGFINTPPGKFFEVQTIADAVLANVELRGVPQFTQLDEDSIFRICDLAVSEYVVSEWYPNLLSNGAAGSSLVSLIRAERHRFTSENRAVFENFTPAVRSLAPRGTSDKHEVWAVQGYPSPSHHNQGIVCLVDARYGLDYLVSWSDKQKNFLTEKNFRIRLYDLSRDEELQKVVDFDAFKSEMEPWNVWNAEFPYYAIYPDMKIAQ